jgi:branched-subunit amino acid aminotransferase/4-amino-4-deoxychorismate lyase
LCARHQIPHREARLSLVEFYNADEVFTTGTMGELTRVTRIDGREIINRSGLQILEQLQGLFRQETTTSGTPLPF